MRSRVAASLGAVLIALGVLAAVLIFDGHGEGGPAPTRTPAADVVASAAPSSPSPTAAEGSTPSVRRRPATPAPARPVDPPVRVVVENAQIDAPVVAVGIAPDGQMELPPDPEVMGWYRYGTSPGDPEGSVVLGGHLDSRRYGVGPLARLRNSEVGDVVVVTSAAGTQSRYRVQDVESLPRGDTRLAEFFRRTGPPQLVLVTCGGEYDPDRGGYQENLVVTGVPD